MTQNPSGSPSSRLCKEDVLHTLKEHLHSKVTIELKQAPEQALSTFTISFDDGRRSIVAPVANRLAFSFINWNLNLRQEQALGTTQFLSSELEQAKTRLEEQESRLQTFKTAHAGATPDQLQSNVQVLSRLQSDVQSHQDAVSRLGEERILLRQAPPSSSGESSPLLSERDRLIQERRRLDAQRRDLLLRLTDAHPDVLAVTDQLADIHHRL